MDFPDGSVAKESACNARDLGLIPGLGRSPGEGNGNPLQCSCLENPMDRGVWWATVHGVSKSRTTELLAGASVWFLQSWGARHSTSLLCAKCSVYRDIYSSLPFWSFILLSPVLFKEQWPETWRNTVVKRSHRRQWSSRELTQFCQPLKPHAFRCVGAPLGLFHWRSEEARTGARHTLLTWAHTCVHTLLTHSTYTHIGILAPAANTNFKAICVLHCHYCLAV